MLHPTRTFLFQKFNRPFQHKRFNICFQLSKSHGRKGQGKIKRLNLQSYYLIIRKLRLNYRKSLFHICHDPRNNIFLFLTSFFFATVPLVSISIFLDFRSMLPPSKNYTILVQNYKGNNYREFSSSKRSQWNFTENQPRCSLLAFSHLNVSHSAYFRFLYRYTIFTLQKPFVRLVFIREAASTATDSNEIIFERN